MIDIDTLTELKKKIKRLKSEKDKAQGRIEQLLKTLKKDFNCITLEEAESLLNQTEKEQKHLEKKYEKALASFIEKWPLKISQT